MKNKVLILLIFLISVFLIDKINANSFPLIGKVIIIDAGHGKQDPGTSAAGILEKDINLAISLFLEQELSRKGAIVLMTRTGDYDLSSPNAFWRKKSDFDNRIRLINNSNVDLYVSIHLNYLVQTKYSGPQVFYNNKNEKNKEIATIIQNILNEELKKNRQIKKIPNDTYMYRKLIPPGILIECGFLSNYSERNKLKTSEYQRKLAKLIALGIERAL